MISLGNKVRDKVTGFEGIVTARIEFLHGCDRLCVTAQELKDGKEIELSFDVQRLIVLEETTTADFTNKKEAVKTGGPQRSESVVRSKKRL